jgi:methylglutaconyl-CoA hydratase
VQGAAIAGGVGLVCACDIAIAASTAVFAISEVRLGIVPGVISPYVIRAVGERHAYRYFQTAERITAERAREIGLVAEVAPPEELDGTLRRLVDALLLGGPRAQAAVKDLIRSVAKRPIDDALVEETAHRIAAIRATPEGKEGLAAFLEKRAPAWVPRA